MPSRTGDHSLALLTPGVTPEFAPVAANISEQPTEDSAEQFRVEQTSAAEPPITKPSRAEKTTTIEPATIKSPRAEQAISAEPQMTEQTATAQNTPPHPSEDEGYGHRISLDSMIVTPRVPTLVEESTDVGTKGEPETLEETLEGFATNSSTSEKVAFMK